MTDIAALCKQRWDNIAKPIKLGAVGKVVCRLAVIQGTLEVNIDRRVCLVMCADNGVLQEALRTPAFVTASQSVSIAKARPASTPWPGRLLRRGHSGCGHPDRHRCPN